MITIIFESNMEKALIVVSFKILIYKMNSKKHQDFVLLDGHLLAVEGDVNASMGGVDLEK